MNTWTQLSIDLANQRNYLDLLFPVYPTIPEDIRNIDENIWNDVEKAYNKHDDVELLCSILKLKLKPIKDSYITYLTRDKSAYLRNPETVHRICGRLYEMGINKLYERSSEPKETNRKMGPAFRNWLRKGTLGLKLMKMNEFIQSDENGILDSGDAEMSVFAKNHLDYDGKKGLDFIARMHGKYVVGEAKFLTDFGGHQYAQFEDAKRLLENEHVHAIKIAICDGVLYIKGKNKMYRYLETKPDAYNILSSLILREFLYQM